MSTGPSDPSGIFARIELLKKWQQEQQQKLQEQRTEQTEFLSNEHRRMYEALELDQSLTSTPGKNKNKESERNESIYSNNNSHDNSVNYETSYSYPGGLETEPNIDIDKMPIKSSQVEFDVLLEDSLKHHNPIRNSNAKPKQAFLKKGSGLGRFRMSVNDLAHKKPKPVLNLRRNKCVTRRNETTPKIDQNKNTLFIQPNKIEPTKLCSEPNKTKPEFRAPTTTLRPQVKWTKPAQNIKKPSEDPSNYQALLTELVEARRLDPTVFNTPIINQSTENDQKIFEQELLDELKVFELLEQKASNSSFCSTSSLVTRLMEHSVKATPKRALNFSSHLEDESTLPTEEQFQKYMYPTKLSPKRSVTFASQTPEIYNTVYEEEENDSSSSESSESESSDSSVNSDDIADTIKETPTIWQSQKPKTKTLTNDTATNTDLPTINSELLKTRLEQLENELETFRAENARINKLKSELESEARNLDKRKRQLDKQIEEQRKQMNAQLEEEKAKLAKDRTVYDRYARELREGKAARKKEREEINALRSQINSLSEEFKLKESRLSATQARLRNQLRQVEKENVVLRTENNELKTKNAKLEATNKQFLNRRPSDTKVLHEINKNLTKLAQETKVVSPPKEEAISTKKRRNCEKRTSESRKSVIIIEDETDNNNKENNKYSPNTIDDSKTTSFDSIEREYEKMFGRLLGDDDKSEHKLLRTNESTSSDTSSRREETVMEDGSVQITYPNGNVRTVSADEQLVTMRYHNGDVKETCRESGTIRYLYAGAQTWHTSFPDGLELLEFPNGQIEKRFTNGASEIHFPNGCIRCTSPEGTENVTFPDGTLLVTRPIDGEKILTLPNGQREIHTNDHKRREYPDGTVKLLYPDGVQETRYANGRIRLKDKDGNLIMDSAGT